MLPVPGDAFVWGETDCASIVYFYVKSLGIDLQPSPDYETAIGARRFLNKNGGAEDILPRYGFVRVSLSNAEKGDVIITSLGEKGFPNYGIALNRCRYLTSGERGVYVAPTKGAKGVAYAMRYNGS